MEKRIYKNTGAWITAFVTFLTLAFFYSPILFHPQDYLFNDSGDAVKNYYCYAWHVQNDTSFIHYDGTNYPFGEHHAYTDGNPLLSNVLRAIPFVRDYSIALFNLSLVVSFLLCSVLLFKIFKLLGTEDIYAVVASVGITILCPQSLRLFGHFTLAYSFSLPLVIYLLLKQEKETEKNKYAYLLALTNLLLLFIHPYLGMIAAALIFLYQFIYLVFDFKSILVRLKWMGLQVAAPFLLYLAYAKLPDTHADRVAISYGFSYFTSSIETIFISTHKPFRHFLSQIYPIKGQNTEGIAYIGILCVFTIPCLIFLAIKNRKKNLLWLNADPLRKKYFILFTASFCLLIFSMGAPFQSLTEWLADHMKFLHQFRARGRFAWAFYFVVTIGISALVANRFLKTAHPIVKRVVTVLLLLLFFVEGIPYHYKLSKSLIVKNCFDPRNVEPELTQILAVIKGKKAQALIPLPYFHIGTDYYNIPGSDKIIRASLIVSYHSRTPIMAGLTGRNSLSEAEKLIQIVSDEKIELSIKKNIPSDQPFLLLYSKEQLSEEESALLVKGKILSETESFILKEISYAKLFSGSTNSIPQTGVRKNNFLLSYESYFHFESFENLPGKRFTGTARGRNTVFIIEPNRLQKDSAYSLSFWYQARERLDLDNVLSVIEINGKDSSVLASKNIKSMLTVRDQRVFARLNFKVVHPEHKLVVQLNGISDREKVFYVDDLMLRAKNNRVYEVDSLRDQHLKSIDNIGLSTNK